MNLTQTLELNAPVEAVASMLCSEDFNVELEQNRAEVVSTEFRLIHADDTRTTFEVRSQEYKRKKTGGVDRNATVESTTRSSYDPGSQSISWKYEGVGSRWVSVSGLYRLQPLDGQTRIVHEVTIDVHIPLLGGTVAKIVGREFEQAWERFGAAARRRQ